MAKLKINLDFSLSRLDLVVRGLVNTQYLGSYKSVFRGQGLEFEDYRTYTSGVDDASLIDWKASQRAGKPLVKEFVEERNLEIFLVVDVSSNMLTGSTEKLKAEYAAEMIASLAYNMLKAGDAIGLVLFSDKIVKYVPLQSGLRQFYSITNNLSEVSNYGGYSNVDNAIDFVFNNANENSLVILISDFIYPLESETNLKLAARKFDFISVFIRDRVDMELPEGIGEVVVQDPYSEETMMIDPRRIRKEYFSDNLEQVEKVKSLMKKLGADFLFLRTDESFVKPLIEFFKRREAEWR